MSESRPYPGYPEPMARPGNEVAVAALLCGIASLFVLWVALGPLAVGFGALGWTRAKRGAKGKGMSITGVALGVVAIVLWALFAATTTHSPRYFVG